jgi:hypothetical protein
MSVPFNAIYRFNSFSVTIVGIDNPPMLKTDTQETENLDKSIFS